MTERPKTVRDFVGQVMTLENLPDPDARWTARRKADLVRAVEGGLISLQTACDRYRLTAEEFAGWQSGIEKAGLAGVKATEIGRFRSIARIEGEL